MRQVNDKIQESKSLLNCMFPIFPKNSLNVVSVKNAKHHCTEADACTEQGGKYKFESLFHSCMVWSSYPVCLHKYKGI